MTSEESIEGGAGRRGQGEFGSVLVSSREGEQR